MLFGPGIIARLTQVCKMSSVLQRYASKVATAIATSSSCGRLIEELYGNPVSILRGCLEVNRSSWELEANLHCTLRRAVSDMDVNRGKA
jgi:hypothetical protein